MMNALQPLKSYEEFVLVVEKLGFLPFSNNCLGYTSVDGDNGLTSPDQWHTGFPDDPWQWRIKIEQDKKAAYGKLFDKKPGFISIEWYPYFIALRRKGRSFDMLYSDGLLSNTAKQIYCLFEEDTVLAAHEIKTLCGFSKDTASKFEAAIIELQMWMLLTGNGTKRKISSAGELYGWPSMAYSKIESWAGPEIMKTAEKISYQEAYYKLLNQVEANAPNAPKNKIKRFLFL
jgi:hypothetical protein